jgi:hypothetical protein
MLSKLNQASVFLSLAENSYNSGQTTNVTISATNARLIAEQVTAEALSLDINNAIFLNRYLPIILSAIGSIVYILLSLFLWKRLKHHIILKFHALKPEILKLQINNYRKIFIVISLIGVLLIASPTLSVLLKTPSNDPLSEIYFLGPKLTQDSIPSNIIDGHKYMIYIGAGNEMGSTAYYRINLKVGSENETLPNRNLKKPSSLPTLYEYKFFLENEKDWQAPLIFSVAGFKNNSMYNGVFNINGIEYGLDKSIKWEYQGNQLHTYLIAELWIFNETTGAFEYNNQYLSIRFGIS